MSPHRSASTPLAGFAAPPSFRHPADLVGPRAQRTVGRIVAAARDAFLTHGYATTTIDEIARIAKVARPSVYTYFPSKREVLYAVALRGSRDWAAIIASLADRPTTRRALTAFVSEYFDFLDLNGSLSTTWSQAAQEDEEVRLAGMTGHLRMCHEFGMTLMDWAGRAAYDPTGLGLAAWSLLEGSWHYTQVYFDGIDRTDVVNDVSRALWAIVKVRP